MKRRSAGARSNEHVRAAKPWIPLAVAATIAALVLLPVRQQLQQLGHGSPGLSDVTLGSLPPPPRFSPAAARPAEASPTTRTLILYDTTGKWGWLGSLYAALTANLASHFGRWTAQPAREYEPGEIERYTALIYIGSTYGESLPKALLDDVSSTARSVLWIADNIQQLEARVGDFGARYGWRTVELDHARVSGVRYKGIELTRWARQSDGIMRTALSDPSRARVLAEAVRTDGSTFPWAVRSGNLTYVGEVPFTYTSETDRYLAFTDLLFDELAPRTPERHRALVRIEDINPRSDPRKLRAVADLLHRKGIPFGFGVSPYYRDPQGHDDPPHELRLRQAPAVVAALRYMEQKGGVLVEHGYTHQWDGGSNPYDGVTGDDDEFYRVTESEDGQVHEVGPLPGDSVTWAQQRMVASNDEFDAAGLSPPRIFEFPHYAASDRDYRAAALRFAVRWERGTYFPGLIGGGPVRYRSAEGQFFPYVVRDVYGSKVLPENLGAIAPRQWHTYKSRLPRDIVRAARANLVVRDGFAAFYFHPFLRLSLLERAIDGIEEAGYTFVDPASL